MLCGWARPPRPSSSCEHSTSMDTCLSMCAQGRLLCNICSLVLPEHGDFSLLSDVNTPRKFSRCRAIARGHHHAAAARRLPPRPRGGGCGGPHLTEVAAGGCRRRLDRRPASRRRSAAAGAAAAARNRPDMAGQAALDRTGRAALDMAGQAADWLRRTGAWGSLERPPERQLAEV